MLLQAYSNEAMNCAQTFEWHLHLKNRELHKKIKRIWQPSMSTHPKNLDNN